MGHSTSCRRELSAWPLLLGHRMPCIQCYSLTEECCDCSQHRPTACWLDSAPELGCKNTPRHCGHRGHWQQSLETKKETRKSALRRVGVAQVLEPCRTRAVVAAGGAAARPRPCGRGTAAAGRCPPLRCQPCAYPCAHAGPGACPPSRRQAGCCRRSRRCRQPPQSGGRTPCWQEPCATPAPPPAWQPGSQHSRRRPGCDAAWAH